ncbi:MAG: hypothetical protein ACOC80_12870 [Petrotogales bacterium]
MDIDACEMKLPYRKAYTQGSNGSVLVSIPRELGIRPGDFVKFSKKGHDIIITKIEGDESGN